MLNFEMMKPVVAIVGRPNVGKSTLFNAILKRKKAVVEDTPGVTRDLNFGEITYDGKSFLLVDTGGFQPEAKEGIASLVARQCQVAVEEAHIILFVLDAKDGLTPLDRDIANLLRRKDKKVLHVVNKVDGSKERRASGEFFELGPERLFLVSALHRRGLDDLLEEVVKHLPETEPPPQQGDEGIKVAIVGRPNVGKSSLVNRILGFERVIVDERPGTTRDAIDTAFGFNGKNYVLIDTAGIRRRSRISQRLEWYCVWQALRSVERSDVALLVIDALEGPTDQDAKIGGVIHRRGKGCIVVVNKWDLAMGKVSHREYEEALKRKLHFLDYAPVMFVSAKTGHGVEGILKKVDLVFSEARKRINTGRLNRWFREVLLEHQPPMWRNRQVKLYYITQVQTAPPTFVIFANYPEGVKENFQRFLVRRLREDFRFVGTPIRLILKKRE